MPLGETSLDISSISSVFDPFSVLGRPLRNISDDLDTPTCNPEHRVSILQSTGRTWFFAVPPALCLVVYRIRPLKVGGQNSDTSK